MNSVESAMASGKTWFVASIMIRSTIDGVRAPDDLWEESFVLLDASDADEAEQMAARIGKSREHQYANSDGEAVAWEFAGVAQVHRVDAPVVHGAALFSRHLRAEEAESLMRKL